MATGGVRFRFAGFMLDSDRLELREGAQRIEVQPKVLHLLRYLLENAERTVTKEELLDALWPDTTVGEGSLTSVVGRARGALGAHHDQIVRTVHRVGYRMGVPVTRETGRPEIRQAADQALPSPALLPDLSGPPAIAVLAFDNLSGDPEQEYFADGISEDLITRLSSWRSFPVIARNSSFVYKGKSVDVKRIGQELGVRYVVEGSVRKAGDRVRISAQLIDATTGHHIWAAQYDREIRDIFALQDELSTGIVAAIHPELEQAELERVRLREPSSLGAWAAVHRGRSYLLSNDKSNARAREFFEQAIEIDPYLVAGFYGLAVSHLNDLIDGRTDDPERSIAEIVRAAERCIALDEQDALSHLALAFAHFVTRRHKEALAAAETALHLNPSDSRANYWVAGGLTLIGQYDEAIARLERGIRLNPRDFWRFSQGIALAHFMAARYAAALEWAERSLEHRPRGVLTWRVRVASLAQLGRLDEARVAHQEAARLEVDMSRSATSAAGVPAFVERYSGALRKAGLQE